MTKSRAGTVASYTVGQLAKMAGVTVRTLRWYDEIGLLTPTAVGRTGQRIYSDGDLLRLQQIMIYRELDFRLDAIRALLDAPDYDVLQALTQQKAALQKRAGAIADLLHTIDRTIEHVQGKVTMSGKMFEGFSEEKQREYADEARARWGADTVNASQRVWNTYTPEERAAVMAEGQAIYDDVVRHMAGGPDSAQVQKSMSALHAHFNRFYECTDEIFRALGVMYTEDARFRETFERLHPELPEFMRDAMAVYVDRRQASANSRRT